MKDKEKYNAYHKEYQRTYQLEKYRNWKKDTLKRFDNQCAVCMNTENLQLDHIDASKKTISFSSLFSYSEERREKELENCQALCKSCHKQKTKRNKEAPQTISLNQYIHGTGYMYTQQKCRCDNCGFWQVAYKKNLVGYSDQITLKIKEKIDHKYSKRTEIVHGTRGGYLKETRQGLEHCKECKEANAEYSRNRRR